jgi:hypothetical protein
LIRGRDAQIGHKLVRVGSEVGEQAITPGVLRLTARGFFSFCVCVCAINCSVCDISRSTRVGCIKVARWINPDRLNCPRSNFNVQCHTSNPNKQNYNGHIFTTGSTKAPVRVRVGEGSIRAILYYCRWNHEQANSNGREWWSRRGRGRTKGAIYRSFTVKRKVS